MFGRKAKRIAELEEIVSKLTKENEELSRAIVKKTQSLIACDSRIKSLEAKLAENEQKKPAATKKSTKKAAK